MKSSRSSSGGTQYNVRLAERTPLVVPLRRSYGAVFPYYQFVRTPSKTLVEILNRSESMVSLCYRTLIGFIQDDNLQDLQSFLENKQTVVDDRDENGTTALMVAASKGKANFVRELLAHGADPNLEDSDNWTALLCAAKEGHADICLQLLEHNAELEHRDMGGWTPLMWATYKGRTDVVHLLLDRGADVNAHGNFHISSLLWAAGRGNLEIVQALISHGAKINVGDKYGTTALVWASRKGHTEIVDCLLRSGANVDTAGMYSWTALLVATQGNHVDVVNLLLEHKPNINALDKDGCSALMIACKEGYYEIATALMDSGSYINIQDRAGDTNLIHAVKGGHRGIVEALLKKYADVDIPGKDRKTAIYVAVEKQNVGIVKLLLNCNPDLEIATKDGDTPLLKAVKSRNAEIVQLLLDKKAKVSAADKKGNTALHIAMRARSKAIVEILLRNPKHSQLLYRPNRAGETPYNIDVNHQKTILGQIFGARRINTNEDNENMLGYDLYSSALADILSEPSLSMPITVGLYAKWGSGKSFLLGKLKDEMKNFAREWVDPMFQFTSLLFVVILHIALILATVCGLSFGSWIVGIAVGCAVVVLCYSFLALIWFASKRYDLDWPYNLNVRMTKNMNNLKLILQILFCHPPSGTHDGISAQPIRFYFTDNMRVSSTGGGENSVVQMIGSLYDAIESDYGSLATRLYRAFRPKPSKSSSWKLRKLCCLPYIVVFEMMFLCLLLAACALTVYVMHFNSNVNGGIYDVERVTLHAILITTALLLGLAAVANLYTWSRMFGSLLFSQRRHLQRTIARLDTLKSEGFLQALRQEVNLMKDMVKCLDSLSSQQTRLVIFVDGLDSSEQDKVLLILDAVHMLFSDANSPFIVILAIDPHVIAKAVEMNSRRLFSESNIGGHNYLNNMVHLPFYLQNSGLRKVKIAQQTAQAHRKSNASNWNDQDENVALGGGLLGGSLSSRRLSTESSALMSSTEKLKYASRKGSRKLELSESVASSIGSNLNKIGGAQDLTKMLLTDDYFSDVNPRSMRRLMNVVYVTGRLLKAFQIDFNWYRLASWINITEQWPFRTSWIIYHYDLYEDSLDDNTSLKTLYDQIRPNIPTLKDTEPLLELDRDERKFDIFLTFHRSSLLVSDLKIFLPFTINLDPYLKKVIKEETQGFEDEGLMMTTPARTMNMMQPSLPPGSWPNAAADWTPRQPVNRRLRNLPRSAPAPTAVVYPQTAGGVVSWPQTWGDAMQLPPPAPPQFPMAPVSALGPDVMDTKLSTLTVEGVCKLLSKIEDMNSTSLKEYTEVIKQNNINGRVLLHCDLDELKKLLKMNFGDWEMFKVIIVSLREQELTNVMKQDEAKNVRFSVVRPQQVSIGQDKRDSGSKSRNNTDIKDKLQLDASRSKQTMMEKQVTLEEQMICGALQTLNEEACEDVLEETEETVDVPVDADIPQTSVIPPSPETVQDIPRASRSRTNSSSGVGETDFVLLQSSPIGHMHWQPVSICIQGNSESLSEHSSRGSSQPPSPVTDRRRSNSFKMSNLKQPTQSSDDNNKKIKHVVINTEPSTSNKPHSSQEMKTSASQQKPTIHARPDSLKLFKTDSKLPKLNRNRSKSIDYNGQKRSKNEKSTSFEKLHKLKEKLLHSSPELTEGISDTESTPLVSEVSSPSVSDYMKSSSSASGSFPLSPVLQKSPTGTKHRHTSQLTPSSHDPLLYPAESKQGGTTNVDVLPSNSFCSRSRTASESFSNYSLSPTFDHSNGSLSSKSSQSLSHLFRQDAIDDKENVEHAYSHCDPTSRD